MSMEFPSSFKPIQSNEPNNEGNFPSSFKPIQPKKIPGEEVLPQLALGTARGALGGPGSLGEFLNQIVDVLPKGKETAKIRRTISKAIFPGLSGKTIPEIGELQKQTFGEKLEPTTAAGRIGGRAGELIGGTLTGGGEVGALPILSAAASGTLGQTARELGAPDWLSNAVELATGFLTPAAAKTQVSKATKPSGLTTRRFESVKKPKTVSPARLGKIEKSLEDDFKGISEKILSKKSSTYRNLKERNDYKQSINEQFDKVKEISEKIDYPLENKDLKNALFEMSKKQTKGITLNDYEKSYKKEINKIIKDIPSREGNAAERVDQYRKNNESLGQYFEPGKSKAENFAKRDAILDYNRAIAKEFEKEFPDSEFTNLFKKSNEEASKIYAIEDIEDYMSKIFDKGISHKEASKYYRDRNLQNQFKKVLGQDGEKEFKQLLDDFMTQENALKLIKASEKQGLGEGLKVLAGYVIHPALAKGKLALNLSKAARNSLLDKPKLIFTWRKGIQDFKKGKFKEAAKELKEVDSNLKKD